MRGVPGTEPSTQEALLLFFIIFYLTSPGLSFNMWDLSFLTRDGTQAPGIESAKS